MYLLFNYFSRFVKYQKELPYKQRQLANWQTLSAPQSAPPINPQSVMDKWTVRLETACVPLTRQLCRDQDRRKRRQCLLKSITLLRNSLSTTFLAYRRIITLLKVVDTFWQVVRINIKTHTIEHDEKLQTLTDLQREMITINWTPLKTQTRRWTGSLV